MGTTAQKLNKILETKEAIRTAINNKGGTLTTTDTFASYPSAIDSLPSGGGDPLKEYLDETKDASFMFCGYSSTSDYSTWANNLTYERLQKILSYNTTSNVTTMYGMFFHCNNITTIPSINTSLVTDMGYMFYYCSNLTTISQLDTSNVTSMNRMFYYCSKLTTIDITHMNIMASYLNEGFAYGCKSLTKLIIRNMNSIPKLDSSAFNNCYHFTGTTDSTYNPQGLKDGRIYVPDDKVDALKTATNWSVYADIIVPLSTLV